MISFFGLRHAILILLIKTLVGQLPVQWNQFTGGADSSCLQTTVSLHFSSDPQSFLFEYQNKDQDCMAYLFLRQTFQNPVDLLTDLCTDQRVEVYHQQKEAFWGYVQVSFGIQKIVIYYFNGQNNLLMAYEKSFLFDGLQYFYNCDSIPKFWANTSARTRGHIQVFRFLQLFISNNLTCQTFPKSLKITSLIHYFIATYGYSLSKQVSIVLKNVTSIAGFVFSLSHDLSYYNKPDTVLECPFYSNATQRSGKIRAAWNLPANTRAYQYVSTTQPNGNLAINQFRISELPRLVVNYSLANVNPSERQISDACITILLKQTIVDPQSKVNISVCLWFRPLTETVTVNGVDYFWLQQSQNHVFVFKQPITSLQDFDLIPFVNKFAELGEFGGYYVSQIRVGLELYCGVGNITILKVGFDLNATWLMIVDSISKIIGKAVISTVKIIISVPNIGLIIKISPFINLVDDFSYFVYSDIKNFDIGFRFVSELCWNLTHSKWVPPEFLKTHLGINLQSTESSEQKWFNDDRNITPIRLKYRNLQDIIFLNNCKGYLFYTVPISTSFFSILWFIYSKTMKYKLAAIIVMFGSWSNLIISLIGENSQFLAFRLFAQLIYPVFGSYSLLNNIIAIIVLFIVTFSITSVYMLSWQMSSSVFKPALLQRTLGSFHLLGIMIGCKFATGFAHAAFGKQYMKIVSISLIQLFLIISIIHGSLSKQILHHTAFFLMLIGQIFRLGLYFVLFIETYFEIQMNIANEAALTQLSFAILAAVFACNALQVIVAIFSNLFKGGLKKQTKELKPNNVKRLSMIDRNIKKICHIKEKKQFIKVKISKHFQLKQFKKDTQETQINQVQRFKQQSRNQIISHEISKTSEIKKKKQLIFRQQAIQVIYLQRNQSLIKRQQRLQLINRLIQKKK